MSESSNSWSVYLIRTRANQLYTGVTTDVARRFAQHQCSGRQAAKYLKGKGPLTLAYCCKVGNKQLAYRFEYHIKRWPKALKESLVGSQLPLVQFYQLYLPSSHCFEQV
ncbi:GIY-YIG nuclease family protein [Celerinatantimonas yamalensis]|uniref:GIY-YIG nuclease family protein n=1 Tax=Celerinatantimonas yamalensis TaxID=559956 RepID=A0ABW9GCQ4_9GAMM